MYEKTPEKRKCKNDIPGDEHAPHVIPFMAKEF